MLRYPSSLPVATRNAIRQSHASKEWEATSFLVHGVERPLQVHRLDDIVHGSD